jgi:hypothetical protein
MFIVWGKKLVHRRVGYVADFCPICRTPKPFEVKRVGSASHVYYISAGEGELVGFERTCQECGTALQTEPTSYASIEKRALPFDELARRTFPTLDQVLHERLALEERIQRDPTSLTAEERRVLIRNPFLLLSPKVERRFASTHIDKEVGFSILGAIGLLIVGPGLAHAVAPDQADLSVLLFILLGFALVVWQIIASGRRFMKKEIVPVLAGSLRPLRPSEHEISAVLGELRQLRHKMGSKLRPVDLLARLSS